MLAIYLFCFWMDYHGLQMEWNGGTYHLFAYHFLFCFV